MTRNQWTAVDHYIVDLFVPPDPALEAALQVAGDDPNVQSVRSFNAALAAEARVIATGIQTVGIKGYDGLAIALVIGG